VGRYFKKPGFFPNPGNIPFNAVENPHLQKFLELLRPGYKLPSRKALSNELLDEIIKESQSNMEEKISALDETEALTLMQDGWSSLHNDPLIASCIFGGSESHFLNSRECGLDKKTGEFCAALATEDVLEVHTRFGKEVFFENDSNDFIMII
jgi:hypothetical protein